MKRDANGPALSAMFVDYDNIYLSLKRKSEDAAKRFSKDAAMWLRELEAGALITPTSAFGPPGPRRVVLNRCYGNPVPRRNSHDSSTDMSSFPFIRHHFLRSGSEVIDCPPLTAQLKNSADIRIVMDVRDMLTHDTYFDEFVILSSDADFTPLLHRLRAHARRTVIYANDQTVSPYTAISDGEVREADLLRLLLDGRTSDRAITVEPAPPQLPHPLPQAEIAIPVHAHATPPPLAEATAAPHPRPPMPVAAQVAPAATAPADLSMLRRELATEGANLVRAAGQAVPLEALADRLLRLFGHERTVGTGWAGMGTFRDLMASYLPDGFKISEQPPYVVMEVVVRAMDGPPRLEQAPPSAAGPREHGSIDHILRDHGRPPRPAPDMPRGAPALAPEALRRPTPAAATAPADPSARAPQPLTAGGPPPMPVAEPAARGPVSGGHLREAPPPAAAPAPPQQQRSPSAAAIQQMVARIYEACQAPPLSPPEYRTVFAIMAREISSAGLMGASTLESIAQQGKEHGITIRKDDVRFILDVVSEADPWFEQGVSPAMFANRFRGFVVKRCQSHGLALSAEEIDLIDHWFAGAGPTMQAAPEPPALAPPRLPPPVASQPAQQGRQPETWWTNDAEGIGSADPVDDFPRIVRSRLRG